LRAGADEFTLQLPGGTLLLPARAHAAARRLAMMPTWRDGTAAQRAGATDRARAARPARSPPPHWARRPACTGRLALRL